MGITTAAEAEVYDNAKAARVRCLHHTPLASADAAGWLPTSPCARPCCRGIADWCTCQCRSTPLLTWRGGDTTTRCGVQRGHSRAHPSTTWVWRSKAS
mgnify:CR=1 FL=1|jgi:hypothetical protein